MTMLNPLRVLYIEDNDLVREITLEMLEQNERRVVAFGVAEEALDEFQRQTFDIVITDVSLPVMSGLDLVRSIRDIAPAVPIIVATGYAVDLSQEIWGGKVRTILKPFDGPQIDALIAELCPAAEPATTYDSIGPS
ncbi:MAG: response regulator [Gammaproteobacteria bacterium]